MKLLIANRGEIAIRVARTAAELGIATVAIYSEDDDRCLHTGKTEEAVALSGFGAAAYLDGEQIIAAAKSAGCDAIHPGYGFLAESAAFAERCADAGLTFIGAQPATLALFEDKTKARAAASAVGVPVCRGIDHPVSLNEAVDFFRSDAGSSGMAIKPVVGGGGRGIRLVTRSDAVSDAYRHARAEAQAAFGNGDVYVEALAPDARLIEVQILGDRHGARTHVGTCDCSIQRHFQKLVDLAPAPGLAHDLAARLIDAAMRIAAHADYANAGTFEFLVDCSPDAKAESFVFVEANARLEVEHTVIEAVAGIDLVEAQLRVAEGATLAELGLATPTASRGTAVQTRVCMETMTADGTIHPSAGTLVAYEAPSGPGVRSDGFGYSGYPTSLAFDSLLAKVVAHSPSTNPSDAVNRAARALAEFRIEGVDTNIPFLANILATPDLAAGRTHAGFVDEHLATLANAEPRRQFVEPVGGASIPAGASTQAEGMIGPEGTVGLPSPIQGTVVEVAVAVGEQVRVGQLVAVVEAMKLQHDIKAETSGLVAAVSMRPGDVVREGYPVVFVEEMDVEGGAVEAGGDVELDHIRGDLREMLDLKARAFDESHAEDVAKWHANGRRTARENIADLVDAGTFSEFGPLAAGQTAAGVVAGVGSINGDRFDDVRSRALVVHYDAMMPSGTRHMIGEYKQDRVFELAQRYRLPLVLFSEGFGRLAGYGRKTGGRVHIDTTMFARFAQLSGLVPLLGITSGACFGGNAALLGCCDTIIATRDATIGLARPDLIDGGRVTGEAVGPMSVQSPNGVVDLLAEDEADAVALAKRYLSYFQGATTPWRAPDQRRMRHIIPEDRVRTYDVRDIIHTLADEGSVLELRREFGIGVITALFRIEGKPMGLVANNPVHLAGAIDSDGADKGTRFMQLCDAFDVPVLTMMDCPGIMVGPDHEREALVRHSARMFNVGANLTTPMFGVVVRKAYGLGVQAMCGASSLVPFFTVAWPTAEFAGMNIDGGVKLSSRRELMAIEDADARKAAYDRKVAEAYEAARAVNSGGNAYGIDDIIDPADTRTWLARGLKSLPPSHPRTTKKRPYVDTW